MIRFIKKYHPVIWAILIIGLLTYDYYSRNRYNNLYKLEGLYTYGKIKEIKGYGKGTGYNFIYTFKINHKAYESKTDIGMLNIREAELLKNKNFLVVYLKSDAHINRIYVSVPISKNLNQIQLKNFIDHNPDIKEKLDNIPSPSWFWENYF